MNLSVAPTVYFFPPPLLAAHPGSAGLFFLSILSAVFLCLIIPSQKNNDVNKKKNPNIVQRFLFVCVSVCRAVCKDVLLRLN